LTQKQLAEKIGGGFSTVQKYELGIIEPSFLIVEEIASALGVTNGALLGWETDKLPDAFSFLKNMEPKYKEAYMAIHSLKNKFMEDEPVYQCAVALETVIISQSSIRRVRKTR
jgi:transcriptional regulator with XRE-family HTH domain